MPTMTTNTRRLDLLVVVVAAIDNVESICSCCGGGGADCDSSFASSLCIRWDTMIDRECILQQCSLLKARVACHCLSSACGTFVLFILY